MALKKTNKWKCTDHWELGYDFSCPNCNYTILTRVYNVKKPNECPRCKIYLEN